MNKAKNLDKSLNSLGKLASSFGINEDMTHE